jgi:uncharacterized membrane protein required for colicin V production
VIIDLLVLANCAFAVWRGRRNGLVKELPSLVGVLFFLVAGVGMFKALWHLLDEASRHLGQSMGVISFVGLGVASWQLLKWVRGHIAWIGQRWPEEPAQRLGGAMAGGVRSLVVSATLLLILAHWPLSGLTRWIPDSSLYGRVLIRVLLPVYDKTHGAL